MAALFFRKDGSYSQERYVAVGTRVCGVFPDKVLDPIEPRTNNFRL
jgi:hypothetical protein